MKNIKLLGIPLFLLGFMATSCSNDDENKPNSPEGPEIRFTVVAPPTPRVTSKPETTTASIDYFLLNAFSEGTPYISNLNVTKSNNNWVAASPIYWPANPVNFYAVSPDIRPLATRQTDNSFLMAYSNDGKVDLLYSVATDQTQTDATNPQPVTLNFRHALSRVAVLMRSTNSQIKVNISQVAFANILQTGIFEFPKSTTAENSDIVGSWSEQTTLVSPVIYSGNATLGQEATEFSSEKYHFAMPQALSPVEKNGASFDGSFIEVKCNITNENGVALWPNSSTPAENKTAEGDLGIIRFPLTKGNNPTSWDAGKAYIYNILINEAPGLSGIEFSVTVDEIDYNHQIPIQD